MTYLRVQEPDDIKCYM